ncbi:MAG: PhzF family phenazine biosynthesis protein, partial [Proteobacteria bacterium]|nr:PhzF family phenazine biosynthesis protein [Pseudomonadota bacterium]
MARYRYITLDVFTDRPFGGNPLAVFPEAAGIGDEQMQPIAREFNLSETVFILAGTNGADADLRIFTPAYEMPFAGHPTVGSCLILAREGRIGGSATLSVKAGKMAITVADGVATITAPQPARTVASPAPDAAAVASALSLESGEVLAEGRSPAICSAGVNFLFACTPDRAALARAQPGTPGGDTVGAALVALDDLADGIV